MGDLFAEAKSRISKSLIETSFSSPGSHWRGEEFYTRNPMRPDQAIGSFSIKSNGKWYDFADGTHGDVIDLLAAVQGKTPAEVAKDLAPPAPPASAPAALEAPKPPPSAWRLFDIGKLPPFDPKPDYVTTYPDPVTGKGLFVVRRYNLQGGQKDIMPIFLEPSGTWKSGIPPGLVIRPLTQVDPAKVIVVVEGEKCQIEATAALGDRYCFVCWHGGAQAVSKVRVEPLRGCDVVLWPDNDEVGKKAMEDLKERIRDIATRVRMVTVPDGTEKGWDVADALEEGRDIAVIIESSEDTRQAVLAPGAQALVKPHTDLGNAEILVAMFDGKIKFNIEKGLWLAWDGNRWNDSDQTLVMQAVKQVIGAIMSRGDPLSMRWAMRCQSRSAIDSMLSLVQREQGVPIREVDLDPNPWMLNTTQGMVDLRTGDLSPAEPSALVSKVTGASWNPGAKAPRFMRFLNEIFLSSPEVIEMIQRWFGYSATGDTGAQSFLICYGLGANGKSTLVELISRVLGSYAKSAPPDMFIQKQAGGIPNDVAALRGARMVLTSETESNAKLAETKIKALTGGDAVSARFMRGEFFEYRPTHKIVISTNHKPRIYGSDYGIWRRVIMVPFKFTAPESALDPDLPRKLWEERDGVLSWIVEGARKWYEMGGGRVGLAIPDDIRAEVQAYREEEDIVGRFISDRCRRRGDPDAVEGIPLRAKNMDLYNAFKQWAQSEGEIRLSEMSQKAFSRSMAERGFESRKGSGGMYVYDGIQIRSDYPGKE